MSKITRALQKIFGNGAGTGEFGVIGSKSSGTPVTTKDIDNIQSDPNYLLGLFGVTSDQGTSRLPYTEDMNSLFFMLTTNMKYMYQSGIPEWRIDEDYYTDVSLALDEGIIWKSTSGVDLTPNTGNKPSENPSLWTPLSEAGFLVSDLRLFEGKTDDQTIKITGHTEKGDVQMPPYFWDSTSVLSDNNGSVIKPSSISGAGRWVWKNVDNINVKQFGADDIGVNDSSEAFINAIEYVGSLNAITTTLYKGRKTLNLGGGSYKINEGFLTVDSSKIRIDGNGASLDFSDHAGDVAQYLLLTNTGDLDSTYSNTLCTIENLSIQGRGKSETSNNTGILIETTVGGTVSTADTTLRNLFINGCYIGVHHVESSYNITYDTCRFGRNTTCVLYTNSPDMFERSVFNSCTFFNSNLAVSVNAPNGTVYMFGCSLDYNTVHVEMTAGGLEMHGCHVEGSFEDDPMFKISGAAVFLATGGWWQFKGGVVTATQEFDASTSNPGLVTIRDVRFSSFGNGVPFTLNPENVDIINPKADSTSLLSLSRFNKQYATDDRFFSEGRFVNDIWVDDVGTVFTDRHTTNGTVVSVETGDPANAYSGDNYMLVDKKFGNGAECLIYMAAKLTDKRRGTISARIKALAGSTAEIYVECLYAVLSPRTNVGDFKPYDIISQRQVGIEALNLTSNYQAYDFSMREKARDSDTHVLLRIKLNNLNNSEIAVDDMYISLV